MTLHHLAPIQESRHTSTATLPIRLPLHIPTLIQSQVPRPRWIALLDSRGLHSKISTFSTSILPWSILSSTRWERPVKSLVMLLPVLAEVVKKGNWGLGELVGGDLRRSDLLPTSTTSARSFELSLISFNQESIVSRLLGSFRS